MRLWKLALGFSILFVATVLAQQADKYVSPKKDDTGVFANETRKLYEQPAFKAGVNDRLKVLRETKGAYQVDLNGTQGWVTKGDVVATGKSKTFVFDNADVIGYLDNPTPVYIIDADDPNANPITLDRSFKDALRENVDRETVERQVAPQ
jgi:hypothetical protein